MDKIKLNNKRVIITGAAGFIGANLVMELLHNIESVRIIGIDSVNDYYDVSLKEYRLQQIEKLAGEVTGTFEFIKGNIADKTLINEVLFIAQYNYQKLQSEMENIASPKWRKLQRIF